VTYAYSFLVPPRPPWFGRLGARVVDSATAGEKVREPTWHFPRSEREGMSLATGPIRGRLFTGEWLKRTLRGSAYPLPPPNTYQ
jgi:hypothetical protein